MTLRIALVNNMPDAALKNTERQFRRLLEAAGRPMDVSVAVYSIPEIPRTEDGRRFAERTYRPIEDLWTDPVDGLIVTGTEPHTENLTDEPYWGTLTRLMEWAEAHTESAIWSCLSAHAAVLHLDGITRRPLSDKRFGVFDCARVSDHPLVDALASSVAMPHSRWNEIPGEALARCGYEVLTRSPLAGVDAFLRRGRSLFVFFQGHPEYDADTLLLEYRRDVRRFLSGQRSTYPSLPHGYFDETLVQQLKAFEEQARAARSLDVWPSFPASPAAPTRNTWRSSALVIYRNWLRYLADQKSIADRAAAAAAPLPGRV